MKNLSELESALLNQSSETGKPLALCLAELFKRALMCDSSDILHVNGIEFMSLCDKILKEDSPKDHKST